jgi:hypothetical protein
LHGNPVQQSVDVVHAPPCATQELPQTPFTHGKPQQSADDAQVMPVWLAGLLQSMPFVMPQRGMPSASWWQVSCCCTLPAQHSSLALQLMVWRRQIPPAGVHTWPLSQRPTVFGATFEHFTSALALSGSPGPPQQSESV